MSSLLQTKIINDIDSSDGSLETILAITPKIFRNPQKTKMQYKFQIVQKTNFNVLKNHYCEERAFK